VLGKQPDESLAYLDLTWAFLVVSGQWELATVTNGHDHRGRSSYAVSQGRPPSETNRVDCGVAPYTMDRLPARWGLPPFPHLVGRRPAASVALFFRGSGIRTPYMRLWKTRRAAMLPCMKSLP
jgi:hypothetical protein